MTSGLEYESSIPGFEVWRDADGQWHGRHQESGRKIRAGQWDMLVWRAREALVFLAITNIGDVLDQAVRRAGDSGDESSPEMDHGLCQTLDDVDQLAQRWRSREETEKAR
jgi:hypothetical protein